MVKNRLGQEDAQKQGWLLDGYPRSAEQAEAIEAAGIRPDVFILIDVRAAPPRHDLLLFSHCMRQQHGQDSSAACTEAPHWRARAHVAI
jgi:adenylate kinase family enzyme